MTANEIVEPEPHSRGSDPGKMWSHIPRWLRLVLTVVLVATVILVFIVFKQ